jgi:hypothetical protein
MSHYAEIDNKLDFEGRQLLLGAAGPISGRQKELLVGRKQPNMGKGN